MYGQFPDPSDPNQQKYKFGFFLPNNQLRRQRHLKERGQKTYYQPQNPTLNLNLGHPGQNQSHFDHSGVILPENILTNDELKYQTSLYRRSLDSASGSNINGSCPPLAGAGANGEWGGCVSGNLRWDRMPWNSIKECCPTGSMDKDNCLENIHLPSGI